MSKRTEGLDAWLWKVHGGAMFIRRPKPGDNLVQYPEPIGPCRLLATFATMERARAKCFELGGHVERLPDSTPAVLEDI